VRVTAVLAGRGAERGPELAPQVALVGEPGHRRRLRRSDARAQQPPRDIQPGSQPEGVRRHAGLPGEPADHRLPGDGKPRGERSHIQTRAHDRGGEWRGWLCGTGHRYGRQQRAQVRCHAMWRERFGVGRRRHHHRSVAEDSGERASRQVHVDAVVLAAQRERGVGQVGGDDDRGPRPRPHHPGTGTERAFAGRHDGHLNHLVKVRANRQRPDSDRPRDLGVTDDAVPPLPHPHNPVHVSRTGNRTRRHTIAGPPAPTGKRSATPRRRGAPRRAGYAVGPTTRSEPPPPRPPAVRR
jgi:hypothetical protein